MDAIDEIMLTLEKIDEANQEMPDYLLLPYDFANRVMHEMRGAGYGLLRITKGRLSHIEDVRVVVSPDIEVLTPVYKSPRTLTANFRRVKI